MSVTNNALGSLTNWLQCAPAFGYNELKNEILNLSPEDRLSALRDVYGIADDTEETPEFLRSKLEELNEKISEIEESEACEMASFICPQYADSPEFRLLFLRAESFDVEKAAKRMVKYWDRKVQLFGSDRAFRALSMLDFDKEDTVALEKGGLQILPARDEAGRAIGFLDRRHWNATIFSTDTMIRNLWYIAHITIEDETVQKTGIILLVQPSCEFFAKYRDFGNFKVGHHMRDDALDVLPIKFVAFHRFCSNTAVKVLLEHTLGVFTTRLLARLRQYDGNAADNEAELRQYGISLDMVPPELGGTLQFDYQNWLRTRLKFEQERYHLPNGTNIGIDMELE